MNKLKSYKGNLNIEKNSVSIDTEINYQAIEIQFVGQINITSMLPNSYIVQKGQNKIIILKLQKNLVILKDLFSYSGMAMITKCMLVTEDLNTHNLYVNKSNLELWNTLKNADNTEDDVDWAYLTKKWEGIDFNGNNTNKNYYYKKTTYDNINDNFTTVKEIRKK